MPHMFVSNEVRATCYKQKDTCDANGNPRTVVHHIDFNHDNNDPENLIWLSSYEHNKLHANARKRDYWDRVAKSMTEVKKGAGNAMYGKRHSDETKTKMSAVQKGHACSDTTRHRLSMSHQGKTPWNKGKTGYQCPHPNRRTNLHWYNNGVDNVMTDKCPDGYKPGKIQKRKEK